VSHRCSGSGLNGHCRREWLTGADCCLLLHFDLNEREIHHWTMGYRRQRLLEAHFNGCQDFHTVDSMVATVEFRYRERGVGSYSADLASALASYPPLAIRIRKQNLTINVIITSFGYSEPPLRTLLERPERWLAIAIRDLFLRRSYWSKQRHHKMDDAVWRPMRPVTGAAAR